MSTLFRHYYTTILSKTHLLVQPLHKHTPPLAPPTFSGSAPPSITFINQSHGPMFEDLLLSCKTFGARVALIAGTPISERIRKTDITYLNAPACRSPNKLKKMLSWILFSARAVLHIALHRKSHYIVTSNPPVFLLILATLRRLTHISYSLLIYDVYPEALERNGLIRANGFISQIWRLLSADVMKHARKVYTIAPCLRNTLEQHFPAAGTPEITVFPTWTNTNIITAASRHHNSLRTSLGLAKAFVITYAGNLSPTHDLDIILRAARLLHGKREIAFVFIGDGAARQALQAEAAQLALKNVHFLPRQPDHRISEALTLGDSTVVCIGAAFGGVSMPSKLYPALASGTPILAVTPAGTYLETVVDESGCGLVIRPHDGVKLAEAVLYLYKSPDQRRCMSHSARTIADQRFSRDVVSQHFAADILAEITRHSSYGGRRVA